MHFGHSITHYNVLSTAFKICSAPVNCLRLSEIFLCYNNVSLSLILCCMYYNVWLSQRLWALWLPQYSFTLSTSPTVLNFVHHPSSDCSTTLAHLVQINANCPAAKWCFVCYWFSSVWSTGIVHFRVSTTDWSISVFCACSVVWVALSVYEESSRLWVHTRLNIYPPCMVSFTCPGIEYQTQGASEL